MKAVRRVFSFILNPRTDLSSLRTQDTADQNRPAMEVPGGARGRRGVWKAFFNLPLVFGGLVLLGLFLVVLFGPVWAPRNPYIAGQHILPHYDSERDEWISPPLEPSAEYLLGTDEYGNDLFSMLLHGARNTLIAAAFIAMARIILGLVLGAYAGWNEGKTGDRFIMGTVGVLAAVPIMISGMILIFALDIRRGLPVFIVALTVIGWTEIAQYVRGEFLILRKKPYIEGARSAGSNNPGIAVRHVLPNLLPQLLVITFLEVAAVLMLFGELGFIGVYIGGGSNISVGDELTGTQVVTLAEVPEWGAMLAEGYRWLRAKPFIVFPPALAFFIAVVGFNAFGEGLRRFIETYHVNTNFLLSKRMLAVVLGLTLATVFIISNTGPAPWFAKVAQAFDSSLAYTHTETLAAMAGRGAAQPGADQAADYIAQKFIDYGLDPGWRQSTYVYPMETQLVRPRTQPFLQLQGDSPVNYRHQLDFGFMIEGHGGSGEAEGEVAFVGFDGAIGDTDWQTYQGLDLRDRIVLLVEGNAPAGFATEALIRGAQGVLWLGGDGLTDVRSQFQLADPDQRYLQKPTIPVFRIRPAVATDIAELAGLKQSELLVSQADADQAGPGWFSRDLGVSMQMALDLEEPQNETVPVVLGYLHGSDFAISNEMVVLIAAYDGLGTDPDGTVFPAANHNATGVSLLLEVARLWQQQELDPRRSVLFIAWGAGQLDNSGVSDFMASHNSFRHLPADSTGRPLAPTFVFQLDYVGAGTEELLIHPASNSQLAHLFEDSAAEAGVPISSDSEQGLPEIEIYKAPRAAWLSFAWKDAAVAPIQDTLERISAEKLQAAGEILSHVLTQIVRQSSF